jgi:hypothetical protein
MMLDVTWNQNSRFLSLRRFYCLRWSLICIQQYTLCCFYAKYYQFGFFGGKLWFLCAVLCAQLRGVNCVRCSVEKHAGVPEEHRIPEALALSPTLAPPPTLALSDSSPSLTPLGVPPLNSGHFGRPNFYIQDTFIPGCPKIRTPSVFRTLESGHLLYLDALQSGHLPENQSWTAK